MSSTQEYFDAKDFRSQPQSVFKKAFEKLELSFSDSIISWKSTGELDLGNIGNAQKHWYQTGKRRIVELSGCREMVA
jgi:hypothetical protein